MLLKREKNEKNDYEKKFGSLGKILWKVHVFNIANVAKS